MPMPRRDSYLAGAVVTAAVFLLYLLTLSPSAAMWDAGEYIAAVKSLGVPHQPGNPLFVLIGHVAGMVPLSSNYAVRINILAALGSAIAGGLWFLCAERVLRERIASNRTRLAAAAVAALLGATAFTVWNQSVVMEKVYPVSLAGLARPCAQPCPSSSPPVRPMILCAGATRAPSRSTWGGF